MINKLWMVIDLQLPLVKSDMNTFLLQDGEITQDDLNNFNNAEKIIRQAYQISDSNESKAKDLIKDALQILDNIKPKKPFPPEMRIRFEELKASLKDILSENVSQSAVQK
ncbi:hypothetical protein B6F84_09495 [Acidianus manzaensis]|uniref:Uncharacterized protein n=1 Tax=Acidianus manzaensis TaxID=282676 RepID=A0A1W6K3M8_9CREN|nr:hypothetical protein B6F84_09495 [Acidianus manzaensis]